MNNLIKNLEKEQCGSYCYQCRNGTYDGEESYICKYRHPISIDDNILKCKYFKRISESQAITGIYKHTRTMERKNGVDTEYKKEYKRGKFAFIKIK